MRRGIAGAGVTWVLRTANSAHALSTLHAAQPGLADRGLRRPTARRGSASSRTTTSSARSRRAQFPDVLKQATVAIEDERFYKHKGVDYEGIIRAAVKNATAKGKTVQGGSTLTMQLVRLLYTQDDTRDGIAGYERKIKEAKLARDLEEQYSKKWVVGKYLNTVPYGTVGGQTAIGAGAASRLYFNKPAKDLTLRQAAMLAGMPQAPSQYSPVQQRVGTIARRNEVLGKMAELGYITRERPQTEMKKKLGLNMEKYFQQARERYVLDYVKSELIKEYGIDDRSSRRLQGLHDDRPQEAEGGAFGDRGAHGQRRPVVRDRDDRPAQRRHPRHGVLAGVRQVEVQPRRPGQAPARLRLQDDGADDRAAPGREPQLHDLLLPRQDEARRPAVRVPASPWDVKTYSGKGGGSKNLVSATLASDNVIYAQLTADLGPDKVKETARMMGIKSELHGYCAESLGGLERGVSPLEMANAYATIVNGGYRNRPRAIKKIVQDGKTLKLPKRWRVKRTKAFSDGVTYEAVKILEQNMTGGTGGHAVIGCPAGGKTGTTDKNIDAWFVGFTPRLSTAVWVGFPGDARRSMNGMYAPTGGNIDGGTYPADIGAYMKKAAGSYCGDFKRPTEPFTSQPFQGHYSRQGGKGEDESGDDPSDAQAPSPEPRPSLRTARTATATPTAAETTATTAATTTAATTARPSTRTSTRPRRRAPPRRSPAVARKHRPETGSGAHSGLVQLAPSGPSTAAVSGGSMREGSARQQSSRMLVRGVAVRWLPVS